MRSSTRRWLIAAAVLVVVGIAACGVAMAKSNWDINELSTVKYETNTVNIGGDFRSIRIVSDTEDIKFVPAEDGKCKVVFLEREDEKHSAEVQNGTLVVTKTNSSKWYDRVFSFSTRSPSITVYLPKSEYAVLDIKEDTGDITIPKNFEFESIDISVSTGDVSCNASVNELLRIKASTGDINIERATAGDIDLTASTGRVNIKSVVCSGDIKVVVSTGKSFLTDVSCRSLESVGDTGDITLNHVIVQKILIERTTGDVSFEKCDAAELSIRTDTGDVSGSLLSEKIFITKSNTGKIDVPETVTGGKCEITTDTGDIKIVIQ